MSFAITMKLTSTSRQRFEYALAKFEAFCQQATKDVILEEMALMAREAMVYTPPMPGSQAGMIRTDRGKGGKGLTPVARRAGENAVAGDIQSLFTKPQNIDLVGLIALAIDENDKGEFNRLRKLKGAQKLWNPVLRKIAADPDDDRAFQKCVNLFSAPTSGLVAAREVARRQRHSSMTANLKPYHDKIRGLYQGRIRRHGGPKNRGIHPLVVDPKVLNAYIKSRQMRVGFLKAGWRDAIVGLPKPRINGIEKNVGTKGLPVWVTRHSGQNGYGRIVTDSKSIWKGVVGNRIGDIFGIGKEADVERAVLDARAGKLLKRADHFIAAEARKFNSRR